MPTFCPGNFRFKREIDKQIKDQGHYWKKKRLSSLCSLSSAKWSSDLPWNKDNHFSTQPAHTVFLFVFIYKHCCAVLKISLVVFFPKDKDRLLRTWPSIQDNLSSNPRFSRSEWLCVISQTTKVASGSQTQAVISVPKTLGLSSLAWWNMRLNRAQVSAGLWQLEVLPLWKTLQ